MGIRIIRPGQFTSVQDAGRYGYQRFSFGVSGVMDHIAFRLANQILGNPTTQSVLEFTLVGPKLLSTEDVWFTLTGGEFAATLNGKAVPAYTALEMRAGDCLDIKGVKEGNYGYLAFSKALAIHRVMGSDSTNVKSHVGGVAGRILKAGDELGFRPVAAAGQDRRSQDDFKGRHIPATDRSLLNYADHSVLRVVLGPQEEAFTEQGLKTFLGSEYRLTEHIDRMGYRMAGEAVEHRSGADIISDGTAFGVVQIPADGQPIILMADRQTTGGYTKIATVISADLPGLVQGKPGTAYRFQAVQVEEAQALLQEMEENFQRMQRQLRHKVSFRGRRTADKIERLLLERANKQQR